MIDPIFLNNLLLNIGINITSNGLTSLITHSSKEIKELLNKKEASEQTEEETALQTLLEYAINNLDERISLTPSKGREILSLFLHSSEVEEIVRQIYSINLEDDKVSSSLESIRSMFITLLTQYFAVYPSEVTLTKHQLLAIANPLFDALLKGCEITFDDAVDKGILAAHEAKEAFRFNILRSQIASIQKEFEFLPTAKKLDIKAIFEFEKQYRERVGQRHGRITPPNLNSAQPHPIDALYVYPKFTYIRDGNKFTCNKDDFFSNSFRVVVLGNPGGGKSTLALKLCHELANNYSERIFAGRKALTPILVVLRNYGAEKKERKYSILDFIEAEVKSTYQLPMAPYETFQYLLLTGRAMIIFDGLDELLDTTHRQEIRDDVELFCSSYPSVPVLVTSREVGYEQAPLDKNMFQVLYLDQFDKPQVKEYVTKWFSVADLDKAEKQRQVMAEAFLTDSEIVNDLRSNPLMLALLCTIYRDEHYIPRYRPDVYEKCAVMLFERWDKNRSIYYPPLPEEHIRPLLEHLANWIYSNEQLRAGVTEDELSAKTTKYLHEWIYENIYKAERTAQDFIKFCVGRAWVFTDTGTKKEGERLYQFVHPTFLEYFAASYYVRTCRTPKELLGILKRRIAKREWDVMAQLAFQLQHKKNMGAGDELLRNLVNESLKNTGQRAWNMLSFAVRCLQFIVPRPEVRHLIIDAFLELCLLEFKQLSVEEAEYGPTYVLDNLLKAVPENMTTIIDNLKLSIINNINSNEKECNSMALELLVYIGWHVDYNKNITYDTIDYIVNSCSNKLEELYPKYILLGHYALWHNVIDVSKFIRLYRIEGLSIRINYNIFRTMNIPVIEALILYCLSGPNTLRRDLNSGAVSILKNLGKILSSYSITTPWFNLKSSPLVPYELMKLGSIKDVNDMDLLFSIFIALASFIELNLPTSYSPKKEAASGIKDKVFKKFLDLIREEEYELFDIFNAYIRIGNERTPHEIPEKYTFTNEQRKIINLWINKKFRLVNATQENPQDNPA